MKEVNKGRTVKRGKHHNRYPVTPRQSWYELLGKDKSAMKDAHRRQRWEKWKRMAIEAGDQDTVDYWSDHGECGDCIHKDGDWCRLMQLPVTINPALTMGGGMIGFACMGAGHESPGQKEMEFDYAGLGF